MALNLGSLRALVRNLVLERNGDTGLITDGEANDLINVAHRQLFNRLVGRFPDLFSQRTVGANLAVPSSGILPFSTVTTGNVHEILHVLVGPTGAFERDMRHLVPFDKSQDRWVYEPQGLLASLPARWYVEGNTSIVFTPLTNAGFDCRVAWIQVPVDMAIDADVPWGGRLQEYTDHIAMLATIMVLGKDSNGNPTPMAVFKYLDDLMQSDMGQSPARASGRAQGTQDGA